MIEFRLIEESDLPLLHHWQNLPPLNPYYQRQQPISAEDIRKHYLPRILGQHKTYGYVAVVDKKPAGYFQCYKTDDHRDYAMQFGITDGLSIDFYIGDATMLGKGVGKRCLEAFMKEIVFQRFPDETQCYVWHNIKNARALSCSHAAGFSFLRLSEEKGEMGELLIWRNEY